MATFTQNSAADYDIRIARLVPGYELLHGLTACVLAAHLPPTEAADILIAGLGTGRELADLAARGPGWSFTAVDPSLPMLEAARSRAAGGGYADRLTMHAMEMQAYALPAPHDAAIALLSAHFVADNGGRAAFLKALARPLRSGAPLLLVDLADPSGAFQGAYRNWAVAQGMDDEAVSAMFARIATNFHPIDEARLASLLADAGCSPPVKYFQALGYCGYRSSRN
ncbi:class I SAM-dependent methyltransferase [Reyranella sp.]|uniref:class I SAM-dependent methyltransferase n=1 Tax=Reyranella sp. TaxID=1929291 RepID=UPI00378367A2